MKRTALLCVALFAGLSLVRAGPKTDLPPITCGDLNDRPVIGRLGKPLGEAFEIEGEIRSGSETNMKGDYGRYLLRVTSVEGKPPTEPAMMDFGTAPGLQSDLAPDDFRRYEELHGKAAKSIGPDDKKELDDGYVGRKVKLSVWETGAFSGIPKHAPLSAVWQDRNFGFRTWLVVLVDHTAKPAEK